MKTFADDIGGSDEEAGQVSESAVAQSHRSLPGDTVQGGGKFPLTSKYTRFSPRAVLIALLVAVFLMDAVLPLRNLWFHQALLTQLGAWPVLPSLLLFPGWEVIPPISTTTIIGVPDVLTSWGTLGLLFATFVLVFLIYLFALRVLPAQISRRFIMRSTLLIGFCFLLIPVVTSPDLYSYIAYARIGIVHGLNPLTTTPRTIHDDVIYPYVSWVDQPSAYGPAWTLLTCFFQLFTSLCWLGNTILSMVVLLRAWGLLMHLCSVALIWSLGGSLQRLRGLVSHKTRLYATLAFAWNPLLLLEACTNAHNDTTLLFVVLLTIWFLVYTQIAPDSPTLPRWTYRLATRFNPRVRAWLLHQAPVLLLAVGTCLKINLVLLAPGLFCYLWLQEAGQPLSVRLKHIGISVACYVGLIVALYAPFWQNGAIFDVFVVNPASSRTINTLADSFSHLYNSVSLAFGYASAPPIGSPAEHFTHTVSMGLFVLVYAALCWQVMRSPANLRTIHGLVRWMAITWLFYCSLGSPWFWPWYLVTFLGLYALLEASKPVQEYIEEAFPAETSFVPSASQTGLTQLFKRFQDLQLHPSVIRSLVFSMFTLYCFTTWGPLHSFAPGLPALQWSYLNGFWAWLVPLAVLGWVAWSQYRRRGEVKK